jgi:hypothetical protein
MASRPRTTSLLAIRNSQSSLKNPKKAAMSLSAAERSARVVSRAEDAAVLVMSDSLKGCVSGGALRLVEDW